MGSGAELEEGVSNRRDKESAFTFVLPGRYVTVKLKQVKKSAK
jgi:hypothetical protein